MTNATNARTNELKKSITSILKQRVDKVYYRKAPITANYPYLTYFLDYRKDGAQYNYELEVHVWTKDVKSAESIADSIEDFDKCIFNNETHCYDLDLNSRNNVEDEDHDIQHIVLLFNLIYFDMRG